MPTYEYVCRKCDHTFEAFQSMSDEPLRKCPRCRKPALRRLVGAGAGLIFKGTGFYITDYKNKHAGKVDGAVKSEAGGKAGGGGGESKGGDTKPAGAKSSSESKPASDSKSGGSKPGSGRDSSHAARK